MNRRVAFVLLVLVVVFAPSLRAADLRELDTRHYHIHTDLDPALSRDLGERMDEMYDEYAQRLSVFNSAAPLPRLQVYLFRKQRDYTEFTHGHLHNSGGAFLPAQNLLAAFLEGQGRDTLRRTLQHEAFHQFACNTISPELPIWLNEGLAQLFEEGLWNGDGFLLGEVPPRRLRQLQADLQAGRLVEFRKLLSMSPFTWARRLARDAANGATQYNQSWAMVHFLVMAKDESGGFRFRGRLVEMLRLLHARQPAEQAFAEAFGSNIHGFEDRFLEYASALKATPEATLIENQGVLADLLVDFARDGRRFDDPQDFRAYVTRGGYRLHYSRGSLQWDTDANMNRYFADLTGKLFGADDLFFWPHNGAPLADLVCRCNDRLLLRTRFYDTESGRVEHELLIEPTRASVAITN